MATMVTAGQSQESLQLEAARICAEAGLTLTDVFQSIMKRIVKEQYVSMDLFLPNEATLEAMRELEQDDLPTYSSVEALMKDLNADD